MIYGGFVCIVGSNSLVVILVWLASFLLQLPHLTPLGPGYISCSLQLVVSFSCSECGLLKSDPAIAQFVLQLVQLLFLILHCTITCTLRLSGILNSDSATLSRDRILLSKSLACLTCS